METEPVDESVVEETSDPSLTSEVIEKVSRRYLLAGVVGNLINWLLTLFVVRICDPDRLVPLFIIPMTIQGVIQTMIYLVARYRITVIATERKGRLSWIWEQPLELFLVGLLVPVLVIPVTVMKGDDVVHVFRIMTNNDYVYDAVLAALINWCCMNMETMAAREGYHDTVDLISTLSQTAALSMSISAIILKISKRATLHALPMMSLASAMIRFVALGFLPCRDPAKPKLIWAFFESGLSTPVIRGTVQARQYVSRTFWSATSFFFAGVACVATVPQLSLLWAADLLSEPLISWREDVMKDLTRALSFSSQSSEFPLEMRMDKAMTVLHRTLLNSLWLVLLCPQMTFAIARIFLGEAWACHASVDLVWMLWAVIIVALTLVILLHLIVLEYATTIPRPVRVFGPIAFIVLIIISLWRGEVFTGIAIALLVGLLVDGIMYFGFIQDTLVPQMWVHGRSSITIKKTLIMYAGCLVNWALYFGYSKRYHDNSAVQVTHVVICLAVAIKVLTMVR